MFCKVYTTGLENFVFMNPNCNIKLIYEYLRVVSDIPDEYEIDLCGDNGYLLGIYDAECTSSGLAYLEPRASYYIFIFSYEEGQPDLFDPRPLMDYTDPDFISVFAQIKKNFGIPKDEFINEEDAALIFEHMLTAYEERLAIESPVCADDAAKSLTLFESTGTNITRKTSRKSSSKNGPCRILQIWREEKRAKLAAQTAIPSEELLEAYQSTRRKSRKSVVSFPGMPSPTTGEYVGEEHEDHKTQKQKRQSVSKKAKKGDKKKKASKDANRVSEKHDDVLRKAPKLFHLPKVNITPENSINSQSETNINPVDANIETYVSIREFFRSHSSSTADLPKPPFDGRSEEVPSNPAIGETKRNHHIVSKKRSNRTK